MASLLNSETNGWAFPMTSSEIVDVVRACYEGGFDKDCAEMLKYDLDHGTTSSPARIVAEMTSAMLGWTWAGLLKK